MADRVIVGWNLNIGVRVDVGSGRLGSGRHIDWLQQTGNGGRDDML